MLVLVILYHKFDDKFISEAVINGLQVMLILMNYRVIAVKTCQFLSASSDVTKL